MTFEQLYNQLFADLHRYAFTILNDSENATDVVQDVFVKYYLKIQSGQDIQYEKAYLYKSVHNTAISFLRKQQTTQNREKSFVSETESELNNQEKIIAQENDIIIQKIIDHTLAQLPEQCRTVFLKSRLEGKKYREIAEEMNLSIKTIESHISKALKIIQNYIRENKGVLSLTIINVLYGLFS